MTRTKLARGDLSPHGLRKHGSEPHSLYVRWKHIRRRCKDPKDTHFAYYGGRGIKVCPEWEDFVVFRDWALANGYADHLTIDRQNNNGDYTPENCRWVDTKTQNRNSRRAKLNMADAEAIRKDPRRTRELAAAYGVSDVSILNVRKEKTWA